MISNLLDLIFRLVVYPFFLRFVGCCSFPVRVWAVQMDAIKNLLSFGFIGLMGRYFCVETLL
jgi:hypothetical protein